jgi:hypothetical protein
LNGYRNTPLFASSSRSLMPVSNGLEIYPNFYELNCADPLPVGQACRLLDSPERSPFWSCRFDRIAHNEPVRHSLGDVESLLTNHPFDALTIAQGRPLTFHLSLFTFRQSPALSPSYSSSSSNPGDWSIALHPNCTRERGVGDALKASILADSRYRPPFELRAIWTR